MSPDVPSDIIDEADRASCPYVVTSITESPYTEKESLSKKRKRGATCNIGRLKQEWPFEPNKEPGSQKMDVSYTVRPRRKWLELSRYNSFVRGSSPNTVNKPKE